MVIVSAKLAAYTSRIRRDEIALTATKTENLWKLIDHQVEDSISKGASVADVPFPQKMKSFGFQKILMEMDLLMVTFSQLKN